jgi:ABC-type multidrug transport system fused ATPase/permease subunit
MIALVRRSGSQQVDWPSPDSTRFPITSETRQILLGGVNVEDKLRNTPTYRAGDQRVTLFSVANNIAYGRLGPMRRDEGYRASGQAAYIRNSSTSWHRGWTSRVSGEWRALSGGQRQRSVAGPLLGDRADSGIG